MKLKVETTKWDPKRPAEHWRASASVSWEVCVVAFGRTEHEAKRRLVGKLKALWGAAMTSAEELESELEWAKR